MNESQTIKLIFLLLFFNFILFISAFFMPAWLYSSIMQEHDYTNFNFLSLIFILICDTSFLAGYVIYKPVVILRYGLIKKNNRINNLFLILPIIPFFALSAYSVFILINKFPSLILSFGTPHAQELRESVSSVQNAMSGAPIILTGVVWWAIFRLRIAERSTGRRLRYAKLFVFISLGLLTINFLLRMSRMDLIPLYFGCFINYKYADLVCGFSRKINLIRATILFVAIGLSVFIVLLLARGFYGFDSAANQIFAYTLASYNRLSAFLLGKLHFSGENSGIYVSSFQGQIPIIKNFFNIYKVLGQPSIGHAWLDNFHNVAEAGLNYHYTFPTLYGAIFSFFGYYSPVYFFLFGLFVKQSENSLSKSRVFGIIFLPLSLFCLLFFFGWNFLLSYEFIALFIAYIYLEVYETMLGLQVQTFKHLSSNK